MTSSTLRYSAPARRRARARSKRTAAARSTSVGPRVVHGMPSASWRSTAGSVDPRAVEADAARRARRCGDHHVDAVQRPARSPRWTAAARCESARRRRRPAPAARNRPPGGSARWPTAYTPSCSRCSRPARDPARRSGVGRPRARSSWLRATTPRCRAASPPRVEGRHDPSGHVVPRRRPRRRGGGIAGWAGRESALIPPVGARAPGTPPPWHASAPHDPQGDPEMADTDFTTDQREREATGAHAYGRYLEEFEVGAVYKHWPAKTVTEADDHLFCLITMNHHPLHINDVYAGQSQQGRNVVVGPAGLQPRAGHERLRRQRQGDRQPRHRGAQPPGPGLPRRHALRRVRGPREARVASPSSTAAPSRSTRASSTRTARSSPSSSGSCWSRARPRASTAPTGRLGRWPHRASHRPSGAWTIRHRPGRRFSPVRCPSRSRRGTFPWMRTEVGRCPLSPASLNSIPRK